MHKPTISQLPIRKSRVRSLRLSKVTRTRSDYHRCLSKAMEKPKGPVIMQWS